MYCDGCGASNRSGARYCSSCGAELASANEAPDTLDRELPPIDPPRKRDDGVPPEVRQALSNEFDVQALIGQGGMGSVYRAIERSLDRPVAIKVLPAEVSEDPVRIRRFLREARFAARLRHPNIVSIHAVGERDGLHYFTMDLIDGESLARFMTGSQGFRGIVPEHARSLVASILDAVRFAHGEGVIHRDLKPANIMIDQAFQPIVLDFGLATGRETSNLTVEGAVLGTPRYMSPEQVKGKASSPAGDVYALGLIYYFVMTGDDLVRGKSTGEIATQHLEAEFGPRVEGDSRVSVLDARLILGMIARDPDDRPNLAQVLNELRRSDRVCGPQDETLSIVDADVSMDSPAPPAPQAKARDRMKRLIDRLDRNREDDHG